MHKNEEAIQQFTQAVNLGAYRVRKGNVEIDCYLCGGQNKLSLHVERAIFSCFKCGFGGSARYTLLRDPALWGTLRGVVGGTGSHPSGGISGPREGISLPLRTIGGDAAPLPPPLRPLGDAFPALRRKAREYLVGRGVTPEQITRYAASVIPGDASRVYFPVWGDRGLSYYMGRALDPDGEPKTLEPGTEKPLFGLHVQPFIEGDVMVLVEGAFDHLATPGSLAVMGSVITPYQLDLVKKGKPAWVAILFDPDARGKALKQAQMLWSAGVKARSITFGSTLAHGDPGDHGQEMMGKVVRSIKRCDAPNRVEELVVG